MIEFRRTADLHSMDVVRDPNPDNYHDYTRVIAMVQWHPGRAPRVVPCGGQSFTLEEMTQMTSMLKRMSEAAR